MISTFVGQIESQPTETLYPVILATVILCTVFSTAFTAARLVAKGPLSSYHVEDYLLILAWMLNVAVATILMLQGHLGIGQHVWTISSAALTEIVKIGWAEKFCYSAGTGIAKAAMLYQIQRIFCPIKSGTVYIVCQVLIWMNTMLYTGLFITVAVECIPKEKLWNPELTAGHCIDWNDLLLATGIINMSSDWMILIMPAWAILHLRMPVKKKFTGISIIFAFGLLACAISVCRFIYAFPSMHSEDLTWDTVPVVLWCLAELTVTIICVCLPLMAQFVKKIRADRTKELQNSTVFQYEKTTRSRKSCDKCNHGVLCTTHETSSEDLASNYQDELLHSGKEMTKTDYLADTEADVEMGISQNGSISAFSEDVQCNVDPDLGMQHQRSATVVLERA